MNTYDILLIDGSFVLSSSIKSKYHLINSYGTNVYPLYKFLNTIYESAIVFRPKEVIVVFDVGRDLKKKMKLESYKKNRLISNTKRIHHFDSETYNLFSEYRSVLIDILPHMGIKSIPILLVEGDTVLYYIGRFYKKGSSKLLISGDKDLLQIIDRYTSYYFLSKHRDKVNELFTSKNPIKVYAKAGFNLTSNDFSIRNLSYYRALVGDQVDNIKGLDGIGPKRASLLIKYAIKNNVYEFTSVDHFIDFYSNLETGTKQLAKVVDTILSNQEYYRKVWEVMDLEYSASVELSPQKISQIEQLLSSTPTFDIDKVMKFIKYYDLNSTDEYYDWLDAFQAIYTGEYRLIDSKFKNIAKFHSLLRSVLHKLSVENSSLKRSEEDI